MGSLVRWDPFRSNTFRELEEINDRFNRFFDRLPVDRNNVSEAMTVTDWMPNS